MVITPASTRTSGYSCVDQAPHPGAYIERLDEMKGSDLGGWIGRTVLQLLQPKRGEMILDVGCGTGDDVRLISHLVGPDGRVCGVDSSLTMLAEARSRVHRSGAGVDFLRGDGAHLPFQNAVFHGCRVERVLQHVDQPREVLAEMVRVARPGGRIVAAEPDYGTLRVAGADRSITQRLIACRCEHFRSATIGRDLASLFRDLDLSDITLKLVALESVDYGTDRDRLLRKYVERARSVGAVLERESQDWLASLQEAAAAGTYRHSLTVFVVGGRKLR